MGWHRHHAIVVTSFNQDSIEWAWDQAHEIFQEGRIAPITDITEAGVNDYRSFLIAPDGSKEGWNDSETADIARNVFITWLESKRFEDGSSLLNWVEVEFSNEYEDYGAKIISSNEIPAGFEE